MELGFAAAPNPTEANVGDSLPSFYLNNSNYNTNPAFSSTAFGSATVAAPPVYDASYATYYSTAAVAPYKVSSTLGYLDPHYGGRTPTFEGWSFGFQRLLTRTLPQRSATSAIRDTSCCRPAPRAAYWNNQLNPAYLSLGSTVLGATATAVNMPTGALPYATFNSKVSQALLPFPQYSGVSAQVDSVGNANYNALQLSIAQRLSFGLTFMLNYTYSKTIDDVGTFRTGYAIPAGILANSSKAWPIDRIERSLSTQDQPQNLVATSTYDLPFGKGHIGGGNAYRPQSRWRMALVRHLYLCRRKPARNYLQHLHRYLRPGNLHARLQHRVHRAGTAERFMGPWRYQNHFVLHPIHQPGSVPANRLARKHHNLHRGWNGLQR